MISLFSQQPDVDPLELSVHEFMTMAGQTTCKFTARQACLYTGLQLEELAEKIQAIACGTTASHQRHHLMYLRKVLCDFAQEFREGRYEGDMLRSDHAELIDADFDLAWVSIGALMSTSVNPIGAIQHGTFTNMDKFRGGVRKDANGKVIKPEDWIAPDFEPYTDKSVKELPCFTRSV